MQPAVRKPSKRLELNANNKHAQNQQESESRTIGYAFCHLFFYLCSVENI
ncbi:hypothetical protein ALT1644_230006 [Alteromonas macleodii]